MASVDFTPIGKRRPNTKFQVIRGHNADENRPNYRNLFHTLKDSTNINHDAGDFSFDTTQEWENDLRKPSPMKRHQKTTRRETVFENVGLGVNQLEELIHRLESEALSWKIKYKDLLSVVEQMDVDNDMIEANAKLRSQLKLLEERLIKSENNGQNEKYLLELEHKDKMMHEMVEDMERMERKLNDADDTDLRHECFELKKKINVYEKKLREYEELTLDKQQQSQEDNQDIKRLKHLIKENDQIHESELHHLKSLLESAELKLDVAEREIQSLRENAVNTSNVKRHFHSDLDKLTSDKQELRKQLDGQVKKLQHLQLQLDEAERTNRDLLRQVEHEREKSSKLGIDLRQSNNDNRSLVDKLDKEKERVKDLVNELHVAQRKIENGKQEHAELDLLLKEAISKNARHDHTAIDRANGLQKENAILQDKVKQLASHCQDLEAEMDSIKTRFNNKDKVFLKQQTELRTLEEVNLCLVDDHAKLVSANESLSKEVENLKSDLQRCIHEIADLENHNDIEDEQRVSRLMSNERALKEEVMSLSKLAIQLEDELDRFKEREQSHRELFDENKDLFDDNKELVRKLKELQRILEDLGVSSKEELEIFETNVRDRIVAMKNDLKDSDTLVRKLENELQKSHEEIRFLEGRVVNKEEELRSVENLLKSEKKEEEESAVHAYQEFQLKKTREELNELTEQLRNTKLDRDAEVAKIQNSCNDQVKELKQQLNDYKSQLSNTIKDYRQLTDKLFEYKTNLKLVGDIERAKYYTNECEYFKQRYRDTTLIARDFKFMYDFAINQIKSSRLKINDDSKLAVVGLYPEYVGGSTKPKPTFKGVATLVLAAVRLKRRTKFEKSKFKELNKTRKSLEDARMRFKEKKKPFVVGIKTM